VTLTMTVGDVVIVLSVLTSAGAIILSVGRRLGQLEAWVQEARDRFDRIEQKLDRVIERRSEPRRSTT